MKILNDNKFTEISTKAENFDRIVAAIVTDSDDMKIEDVTVETVIEALQLPESLDLELHADIDSLESQVSDLKEQLVAAQARIVELENELDTRPAELSATIVAKGEPSAEPMDINEFARKNADNPFLVLEEMKKQQLI